MKIQRALIPVTAVLGILVTGWTVNGVNAQPQPMCLHAAGETPADAVRRADGFLTQLTVEDSTYALVGSDVSLTMSIHALLGPGWADLCRGAASVA